MNNVRTLIFLSIIALILASLIVLEVLQGIFAGADFSIIKLILGLLTGGMFFYTCLRVSARFIVEIIFHNKINDWLKREYAGIVEALISMFIFISLGIWYYVYPRTYPYLDTQAYDPAAYFFIGIGIFAFLTSFLLYLTLRLERKSSKSNTN